MSYKKDLKKKVVQFNAQAEILSMKLQLDGMPPMLADMESRRQVALDFKFNDEFDDITVRDFLEKIDKIIGEYKFLTVNEIFSLMQQENPHLSLSRSDVSRGCRQAFNDEYAEMKYLSNYIPVYKWRVWEKPDYIPKAETQIQLE